jgi:hypothetical protein
MAPVFRSLSGVEACGGGDLTLVTGYYRPGRGGLQGWVEFHSGEISPRQAPLPRLS